MLRHICDVVISTLLPAMREYKPDFADPWTFGRLLHEHPPGSIDYRRRAIDTIVKFISLDHAESSAIDMCERMNKAEVSGDYDEGEYYMLCQRTQHACDVYHAMCKLKGVVPSKLPWEYTPTKVSGCWVLSYNPNDGIDNLDGVFKNKEDLLHYVYDHTTKYGINKGLLGEMEQCVGEPITTYEKFREHHTVLNELGIRWVYYTYYEQGYRIRNESCDHTMVSAMHVRDNMSFESMFG